VTYSKTPADSCPETTKPLRVIETHDFDSENGKDSINESRASFGSTVGCPRLGSLEWSVRHASSDESQVRNLDPTPCSVVGSGPASVPFKGQPRT